MSEPRARSCACTARTASPWWLRWTTPASAFQVVGPRIPSATRPRDRWKARRDASVCGPKSPSTTTELSCTRSRYCAVRTASPEAPRRSTGQGTKLAGAGATVVGGDTGVGPAEGDGGRSGALPRGRRPIMICVSATALRGLTALGAPRTRTSMVTLPTAARRSEEHTSELQSLRHLVCRLLLEKKKY